tara:strand:+ start:743 stop:1765 length:1023 start_codon:yes stop_codon:yes gene_type:complete
LELDIERKYVSNSEHITSDSTVIHKTSPATIEIAASVLKKGNLVAFPTETVYGLGADATNDTAVKAIYEAKNRPKSNPLIIHVASLESAKHIAVFDERANMLARAFWPGALTMILPRQRQCPVSRQACAELDTVAVRIPANETALALLRETARPIAGPSANASGRTSPTIAEHVIQSLGEAVSFILDGGPCQVGIESTVINLSEDNPMLLRPGGIPVADLETLVGPLALPFNQNESNPTSPGRAKSHYAPGLPLRLEAFNVDRDETLLAFGPNPPRGAGKMLNLSVAGDLNEAAANLYRMMIELDDPKFRQIAVMSMPDSGVGQAINDRLRRAAAPRPNS